MEFLLCAENLGDYDDGDIIDIRPDGFEWGKGERENPRFAIVRIPDEEAAAPGESIEDVRSFYLNEAVSRCALCGQAFDSKEDSNHLETVHKDELYGEYLSLEELNRLAESLGLPKLPDNYDPKEAARKSPDQIGISVAKKRSWNIDVDNGVVVKKITVKDDESGEIKSEGQFAVSVEEVQKNK